MTGVQPQGPDLGTLRVSASPGRLLSCVMKVVTSFTHVPSFRCFCPPSTCGSQGITHESCVNRAVWVPFPVCVLHPDLSCPLNEASLLIHYYHYQSHLCQQRALQGRHTVSHQVPARDILLLCLLDHLRVINTFMCCNNEDAHVLLSQINTHRQHLATHKHQQKAACAAHPCSPAAAHPHSLHLYHYSGARHVCSDLNEVGCRAWERSRGRECLCVAAKADLLKSISAHSQNTRGLRQHACINKARTLTIDLQA